jgi:high-affinity iron transporter
MVAVASLLYEERTGSLPLKNRILATLGKVPGLKGWAKKKQAISVEHATEIVRQGQVHLSGGVFHGSDGSSLDDNRQTEK